MGRIRSRSDARLLQDTPSEAFAEFYRRYERDVLTYFARWSRDAAVVKQGSGGGISCIPDSTAVKRGLIQGTIGRNEALMFGALPQGTQDPKMVQANGVSHPIRSTPTGGFVVRTKLPATLAFTQPDGRPVTVPLQPAPGPGHGHG